METKAQLGVNPAAQCEAGTSFDQRTLHLGPTSLVERGGPAATYKEWAPFPLAWEGQCGTPVKTLDSRTFVRYLEIRLPISPASSSARLIKDAGTKARAGH